MIRNRKWLISFAYFFLFNMLVQIAAPTVAYGLSGNPTTPEFDSFSQESSGMVDGITGDFSYSTPIMELPGPEGSYPINAFYKSGIKTEQDASWVGLGWNINAGAITRNVNGFPDDFSGAGYVVTDTWSGSADTSYSLETPLSTNLSNTSVNTGSAINAKYNLFSIDPTSGTNYAYGALHGVDAVTGTNVVLNRMYDSYAKYDPNINIAANPDPEKQMGGSVPAFDQYSVSGHGISGEIEPAIFDNGTLFRKKVVMGTDTFKTYKIEKNSTVVKPQFRFKKEFSNRFQPIPYDFTLSPSPSYPAGPNGLSYLYSSPDVYNGPDTTVGYNTSLKKLAGARNVEYYTNNEIVSGAAVSAGFVKYQGLADGNRNSIVMTIESGTKTYNVANQVGGFSITNVDGTVYHYALPAYSYSYSKKYTVPSTKTSGRTARVVSFTQAYAYTWLLTSITGSDFIDRNANGYADEGDTGFWTNFTYGKKTDNYIYREPFTGTRNEVDGSYAYSAGRKQVYYLDAIFNRTNSVFFSKGTGRLDAKSATDTLSGGLGANSATVLQLDSVMLYDNAGLKTTLGAATIYAGVTQIQGLNANGFIDGADFTSLNSSYPDNATYKIKTTLFVYDYSLCPQTANSSASTTGRLTLTQIKYNGQYGTQIMPPMTFGYELPSPQSSSSISISGISGRKASISVCFNSNIVTGNILKITSGANTYYATLLNQTASGGGCITYNMIFLGNTYPSANVSGTAVTTKNPPYTADFYDMWGYLKSDYQFAANPALQNNSRRVTATSAASTDAWSLRRITNSLGSIIDITYEPDSYNNVEHGVANMYNIDQVIGYKKRSDNSIHYSSEFTNNAFPIGDPTGDWYQIYFADPDTLGVLNNFAVNDSITLSSISAYLDATRTAPATDTTQYGTANFKVIGKGKDVRGCYLTISYTGKVSNTAMESLNPLRYPYTSTANTVRTIFPTGARTTASHLHKHYGSYVTLNKSYPTQAAASVKYGGGARVQKIRSTEPTTGEYYDKVYSYTDNFNVTTGSLSYEPVGFDGLLFTPIASWMGSIIHFDFYAVYHNYFQNYLNGFNYTSGLTNNPASFNNVLAYGKQITAPVVLYQLITVKEISNGSYKSPVYQKKYYQVYTNDLITRVEQSSAVSSNSKARTIFINDKTSRVGNVLSEQNYDKNTDKFLSGSNYTYSNTFDIPNNQGIIGQVSHEHRIFHKGALNEYHYAIVAVNVVYPSVLLSKADVGASHCITNNAINNAFDFYSGDVTELVSTDANGSTFKSQTIPAYVKYPGMGVKVVAAGNKNMLVPTTAGYKIKVDTVHYNSHIDTLTSSISTWSNTWSKRFLKNSTYYVDTVDVGVNIWRQNEVWFWNSPNLNTDGSYKKFTPYAYGSGSQATGWQKQGFIYRYSPFSQKLETKDLNVNSVSTKQGYNQAFTLTAGSNCKYTEIAFSGAEDLNTIADLTYFGGEVSKGGGTQTKAAAHTGKYGLSIAQNNTGFIYRAPIDTNNIERGKPYRASVWINNNGNTNAGIYYKFTNQSGVQLSGTSTTRVTLTGNTNVTTCGNWKLITIDIKVPSTVAQNNLLEVGCDNQSATIAYFDDIRFYPLDQPIVTYVYDPNTKWRTYVLDADNFYTRTQYDNAGRVVAIYRETINGEILRMTKQYNFPH